MFMPLLKSGWINFVCLPALGEPSPAAMLKSGWARNHRSVGRVEEWVKPTFYPLGFF